MHARRRNRRGRKPTPSKLSRLRERRRFRHDDRMTWMSSLTNDGRSRVARCIVITQAEVYRNDTYPMEDSSINYLYYRSLWFFFFYFSFLLISCFFFLYCAHNIFTLTQQFLCGNFIRLANSYRFKGCNPEAHNK